MLSPFADFVTITSSDKGNTLTLRGSWTIHHTAALEALATALVNYDKSIASIDASSLTEMDTAGAYLLDKAQSICKENQPNLKITGLSPAFNALFKLIRTKTEQITETATPNHQPQLLYRLGLSCTNALDYLMSYFAFLGELFIRFIQNAIKPFNIQWRSIIHEVDMCGFRALSIIAVMMFLIGIVLAYQLGVELQTYGANVYVVDVSGVAILREFSPLITSVIIAGRTSTSFAALIGTMKVNEEIDALKTMGMSPMDRLVLPKIIGLMIALPLLVVWGNLFGIAGSMVMSKSMLGMSYVSFLERLRQVVAAKQLYLGLIKTPFFALVIAGIGCFQGFQAEGSAQSVGVRTTKAAVQAIFLIIFADAMFSILFNWMDL